MAKAAPGEPHRLKPDAPPIVLHGRSSPTDYITYVFTFPSNSTLVPRLTTTIAPTAQGALKGLDRAAA